MKSQALFSSKDKSKKLNCCLLQFLFGTLRVNKGSLSQTTIYCNSQTDRDNEKRDFFGIFEKGPKSPLVWEFYRRSATNLENLVK